MGHKVREALRESGLCQDSEPALPAPLFGKEVSENKGFNWQGIAIRFKSAERQRAAQFSGSNKREQ